MTVDVSLISKGRIEADELATALAEISGRAAAVRDAFNDEATSTDYFRIDFQNPFNRKSARTLRGHHAIGVEPRHLEHVGRGEHTYLVLGTHEDGAKIMRALAERFGGYLENDEGETSEYIEAPPASPKP